MSTLEYIEFRDSILRKLLNTTDINVLKKLNKVLEENDNDWYDEMSPTNQKMLDKSIEQAKAGKDLPFDEVIKELS